MNKYKLFFAGLFVMLFFFSGCSSGLKNGSDQIDALEGINRSVFIFNKYVDENVVEPIGKTYVKTVPFKARKSINHHIEWIQLPNTIINSTLQTDLENTILGSAKFMLNGLTLGFVDLDNGDTKIDSKDFGSTLANYNVPEGPFLMVPFLGPKFTRDFSGTIIDKRNLANIYPDVVDDINLIETPVNIIDKREKMSKMIERIYSSPDPYIKMKTYYIQNRRNQVYNEVYKENKNKDKDQEFEKLLQDN